MKKFFYALYALFFNASRIFPVNKNRIAFVAPHNGGDSDSLGVLRSYIQKQGGYETISISTRALKLDFKNPRAFFSSCLRAANFFTRDAKALAGSKFVFLNDNFTPMSKLKFSRDAVVVQLWHAEGAFKKFGLSSALSAEVAKRERKCSERFDYVVCSSKNVVPIYAEAFGVPESKVLPLGSPRTDALLDGKDPAEIRERFDRTNPDCRGKKLVLYAPTFRDDPKADAALLNALDVGEFDRELGREYALLVRLHPQISSCVPPDGVTDASGYDLNELVLISDSLITDYSSVCMNFALLLKPCVFFAYDLDKYEKERSFYFDYKSYVPGAVVETFSRAIEEIKNPGNREAELRRFRDFNFDYLDRGNSRRIFEKIISASS